MKIQTLLFLLLSMFTGCCSSTKINSTHKYIEIETNNIFNKLVDLRNDFSANAELAGKEIRTQKMIKEYLLNLGLEVQLGIYGHSVMGVLKGERKGKKIAWRADMDALPTMANGAWHGCGHDVHMTIGLGIAEVLSKQKASLRGTVYFIFQPEEETFRGAKNMISNGLLSKITIDEIYGLHITALPVGQIMVKSDEMFAYQKRVRIKLKNELSNQESKELYRKINKFLSRASVGTKPWEIQHIADSNIGLMNSKTIFRDYLIMDKKPATYSENGMLFLEANLYETGFSNLKNIIPKIKQVIESDGYKDQLLSVSYIQENPTVVNDKKLTAISINTLNEIYGPKAVATNYGQVPYFNDDFAYFQQKVPGVYFFLGGSNIEKGIIAMNHTLDFKVDEECIRTGVKIFSSLIVERLSKSSMSKNHH